MYVAVHFIFNNLLSMTKCDPGTSIPPWMLMSSDMYLQPIHKRTFYSVFYLSFLSKFITI